MEREIVDIALQNLKEIKATWSQIDPIEDGQLQFEINGKHLVFVAEVKKEIRNHQLHQIEKIHREKGNVILISEIIFPKIKEQLRELGIAYLESNGNVFIKTPDIFWYVDTNNKYPIRSDNANRAFTKTGLKVVFHLLQNADLINRAQRDIAEIANVGLGNIPQVIDGLKKTGYLMVLRKKTYVWKNRRELLDRWINEYATQLRPKLIRGYYHIQGAWDDIKLDNELTAWGGEPAADLLTNHLRPEKFILYTKETSISLMKNYRLIPREKGELEVLEMFWDNKGRGIVPPMLIYAELMVEGGKRNTETAEMIFNEHIQSKL
ncbi:type IV toxin-antitoxin system AbiEi family antitoxin [Fulvivirga ligni]|uniref:type IV toxin-antitoxin system AbiEi family antitoxin n=1 Tax=Fulvivirga ligni TaxID=2904246 RepID=UPI001F26FCAF|nr:type IV toxin-antitoxin system AbiEi family antitoxin [Fulvivirga ligni]UII21569.1 type IV toxin-antitoxin system AbiEi family antitoxin [Fulvivirga ligni]UII21623.1 type IV toxin-antitoxin system AbiEi family antitoxin [Fulvivirga ligni]